MVSILMALFALVIVLTISGTSNGTFLGYHEAISLEREQVISKAEAAFSTAQNSVRKLEQILPIIRTGKETAKRLKEFEVDAGSTGAGKGPIYQELLIQETRLLGTEKGIENVIGNAEQKIRSGRKILASIREAQKDYSLSRAERRRIWKMACHALAVLSLSLDNKCRFPHSMVPLKCCVRQLRSAIIRPMPESFKSRPMPFCVCTKSSSRLAYRCQRP